MDTIEKLDLLEREKRLLIKYCSIYEQSGEYKKLKITEKTLQEINKEIRKIKGM